MSAATSSEPFNAYHQWLGLPPEATSPTYYQILGLSEFEGDTTKIAQAGDRAITRVRSFRPGSHAKEWSRLLDEVSSAKTCLLDGDVKREYDRCLKSGAKSKSESHVEDSSPTIEKVKARAPLDPNRLPPGMTPFGATERSRAKVDNEADNETAGVAELLPPSAAFESLLPPASVDSLLPAAAAPAGALPLAQPVWQQAPIADYGQPPMSPGGIPLAMPVSYSSPLVPAGLPSVNPMAPMDPMAPVSPTYMSPASAVPPGYAAPAYSAPTYAPTLQAPAYASPVSIPMTTAVAPAFGAAAPIDPVVGSKASAPAPSVATVLARRRRQAQRNTLIAAVAGCLLLATGVVGYANRDKLLKLTETQVAQAPSDPATVDTSGHASPPLPRTVEGSLSKSPTAKPEPKPEPSPPPESVSIPEMKPDPATPMASSQSEPKPETQPEPAPQPESKPTAEPAPMPAPEPAPPPMPTKEELAALGKALAAGKAALAKNDFLVADEQIAVAESFAKLPEHQEMAARLKEVAMYVKQFRNAVSEGLKNLQVGAEIKVGTSTMVVVVAVTPERLTIRRAGGNVTYPLDELPAGLTMALADSWFKADDPVNRVVKGAYFAVAEGDVESHREKAKKYWDEAIAAGVDAKPLLPFLTDKYDLEKQTETTKTDKSNTASTTGL